MTKEEIKQAILIILHVEKEINNSGMDAQELLNIINNPELYAVYQTKFKELTER